MPLEITFIRHGQTTGNLAGRWQGHTNSSLTELGEQQAGALAARLADTKFDAIVASDLDRTVQTATALGRPVETDARWREPFFGSWEDRTTAEIVAADADALTALFSGEDVAMGGGETLAGVYARTSAALDDLIERFDGSGSIAVVSHGMALLTLLSGVLGTRRPSTLRLMGNTALATVIVDDGRLTMPRYNDDTHLDQTDGPLFGQTPADADIYLVRHGQTVSNVEGRWQGQQDGQLNDTGRRQAKLLGEFFPSVDVVYSSPLSRAADTAREIADAQGHEVRFDDRLQEIYFGEWEGLTTAEIMTRFPEQAGAFFNGQDLPRGGSGETWPQVRSRIRASLDEIAANHAGDRVAVVAHGGVTRAWVTEVLGLEYGDRHRLGLLGNTGWARTAFGSRGPSIVSWNLAPHLEGN